MGLDYFFYITDKKPSFHINFFDIDGFSDEDIHEIGYYRKYPYLILS